MNGAQSLIRTLVDSGVEVCFMNPGTSEMHFVAALDDVPAMRGVLALFEGVATGAADGYARVAGRPAAVLLHLGPGLGNGLANLHNARRAHSPVVTIVGDHATHHHAFDAPLESDIETVARNVSCWVHTTTDPALVGAAGAEAVARARTAPGGVATLILPADASWGEGGVVAAPAGAPTPIAPDANRIATVAEALRSGGPAALIVGDEVAGDPELLADVTRLAAATGARVFGETFPARMRRGAGLPALERIAYLAEFAQSQLDGLTHLVTIGAKPPASFFAYPGRPSDLVPTGCAVTALVEAGEDARAAIAGLLDAIDTSGVEVPRAERHRPESPVGELTGASLAAAIGALLPEEAIVADEANTTGLWLNGATAGAPPHDWLSLTGGSIGYGMPVATGAAIACPDRRVLNVEADGSALYTFQALWTQAHEGLDVTTVILNNRSYAVLNMELSRVGATPGPRALEMLDLSEPPVDFVALASGLGVPASRVETAEDLSAALARSFATPGPCLIEAMVPSAF
ncbi:MAG: acetolactate synthase large subunit [Actinomycetes bacterium]